MTIPALISQYLYENYRLALPGLGSFVYVPDADSIFEQKKNKVTPTGVLSFENEPAIKENQDLVNYISAKTGKIKALAAADLQSYLELAKQFLNIGKSFLFEGIGSLKKIKMEHFHLLPILQMKCSEMFPQKIRKQNRLTNPIIQVSEIY